MLVKTEENNDGIRTSAVVSPSPQSSIKGKNGLPTRKKSASLPAETVEYLKAWMMSPEHIAHPYPTEQEKAQIMADTGIELKQLTNWFVNNRKRYWKPRVEASLQKQAQAQAQAQASVAIATPGPVVVNANTQLFTASSRNTSFSSLELGQKSPRNPRNLLLNDKATRSISFVGADNLSTFVPAIISRPMSEPSSSASESESVSVEEEDFSVFTTDEIVDGNVVRTETISIHILKPTEGKTPTVEDVSVSPSIECEKILVSFDNCALTYRFSVTEVHDRKTVLSRRDVEILRMKKHYLKLHLADAATYSSKRVREEQQQDHDNTPRKKYRRRSLQLWRDACKSATHLYDDALPSLEEASQLFGFGGKL